MKCWLSPDAAVCSRSTWIRDSAQDLRSTADRFGIRGIGIYDPELRLVQALQISSHPALYVASPTRGVIVMHREYSLGAHARENARKALEAALNE